MGRKHNIIGEQYTRALNSINMPDSLAQQTYQKMQRQLAHREVSYEGPEIETDYQLQASMPRSALLAATVCLGVLVTSLTYVILFGSSEERPNLRSVSSEEVVILETPEYSEPEETSRAEAEITIETEPAIHGDGTHQIIIRYEEGE